MVLQLQERNLNLLSIDFEEAWAGEFCRNLPIEKIYRANETLAPLLELLSEFRTTATFFVVGDSTSDESLKQISDHGHEIAFHTEDHLPLWEKDPDLFAEECRHFQMRVSEVTGQHVLGFRAPSFSMNELTSRWAIPILSNTGFHYDSSIVPTRFVPLYGQKSPRRPFLNRGFPEFPMSVGPLGLPIAGGFYHRLFPERLLTWALGRLSHLNVYAHNWELFPSKEKLDGLSWTGRFYSYYGLEKILPRFKRILEQHKFTSFKNVLASSKID